MQRKTKQIAWIAGGFAALIALIFSLYLVWGFRQLDEAFARRQEFTPTQIYSDVTRVAPPMSRDHALERLKGLGYGVRMNGDGVDFELHQVSYPAYLLPEGHPNPAYQGKTVRLEFDGVKNDSSLQSIQIDGREIPEIYLEPEVVATLARAGNEPGQIRQLLKLPEIPSKIWQAIIAIEDQHFMEHKGLDPRGLARAIYVNLKTLSLAQGGSTLTQQLVKNLMVRRTKNIFRKFSEIFLALILEYRYSKEEILERYLNEVYLGQIGNLEIHGIAEGAKYFFGKNVDELNLAEIAMMAGLIRGPGFYSPYRHLDRALERQKLVLQKMVETGQIAQAEAAEAEKMPIRLAPPIAGKNKAPYFTDFVKAELIRELSDEMSEQEVTEAGFRVYTTLDVRLNRIAQSSVAEGIESLKGRVKNAEGLELEGALATVDQRNGYIRALVGGKSYERSTFNRILNMRRQVGSTFKPIVMLAAIEKGRDARGVPYGPGYPMKDAPWTLVFDNGRQKWSPRNYEKEFRGWTNLREALTHSVNTVFARLGVEVGLDKIIETAKRLGIDSELKPVPALTLGAFELSPVELLSVYSTFANHGMRDELTVIRGITTNEGAPFARFVPRPEPRADAAHLELLNDMLKDVFRAGTARGALALGFDRPAAGKTGTTNDYRDAWFAGFTSELTTVVWVGLDQTDTKLKLNLTGSSAALPIWVRFMSKALEDAPPSQLQEPESLTTVRLDRKTGQEADDDCSEEQSVLEKALNSNKPSERTCLQGDPEWSAEVRL